MEIPRPAIVAFSHAAVAAAGAMFFVRGRGPGAVTAGAWVGIGGDGFQTKVVDGIL